MPSTIYQSLYQSFIRQGFAKSFTQGYAQSVIAATHPHSQNRPTFARRGSTRTRLKSIHLQNASSAFRTAAAAAADLRHDRGVTHGSMDAYFESLRRGRGAGEAA